MKNGTTSLLAAILIATNAGTADQIILKSGTVIKGTVTAFENGILHIRTTDGEVKKGKISVVEKILFDREDQTVTDDAASTPSRATATRNAPETPKQAARSTPSQAAEPLPPGAKRIQGGARFGATDKKYFNKLVGYAYHKDAEAFKTALTAGLLTGQCTMFKSGEAVFITDTSIFSGCVKVRRKGETAEYWTSMEAVK